MSTERTFRVYGETIEYEYHDPHNLRLEMAEMKITCREDLVKIVAAFIEPFPSLELISGGDLYDFIYNDDPDARQRLKTALDKCSNDGEWPGTILTHFEPDNIWQENEFVQVDSYELSPYVGDRRLIVKGGLAIADYSERPSASAANDIVNLLINNDVVVYNDPAFIIDGKSAMLEHCRKIA